MHDFSMVVCLVVAIVVIVIMIVYQKMDKQRYMAIRYIQSMDEDIRDWLDKAVRLLELDCAGDKPLAEYNSLMEQYNGIKRRHAYKRADIINRLHAVLRDTAVEHFDYPGVRDMCAGLANNSWEFADMLDEYNHYAAKLNADLDKPVGGLVGRIFRIKKFVQLDDLSIP